MAAILPEIICRVRAIYPFQSNERASLSFQPGDEIDVLTQLDSGWWDGWSNGMRGWFPCNYVEVIQDGVIDQQYGDNIVPEDDDFIDHAMFTRQQPQPQQPTQPQRPSRQRRHNTIHSVSSSNSSSTSSSVHQPSSSKQQQPRRPKQPPKQHQTNGMDHRLSFLAYPHQQEDWATSRTPASPPMNYHDQPFSHRQFSQDDDDDDDLRSDTSQEMQLPEGWTLMLADDGKTSYYYNHLTGGMRFKHPGLVDSDGEYDSGPEDATGHVLSGSSTGMASSIRLGESSSSRPSTRVFEERKIITADALKRLSMASSDNEDAVTRQLQLQPHYAYPVTPQEPSGGDDDDSVEKMMESWVQRETPQGRPYFCNLITQETTWNYDDIDPSTGHLRSNQDDNSSQDTDQHDPETPTHAHSSGDGIGNDKLGPDHHPAIEPQITWSTLSSDIALAIHQLNTVAQQGQQHKLMPHTSPVVESIRVMLYASGSMEKDVSQTQDPALREPRRAVMASLSKLVLSAKMASEATSTSATSSPALASSATSESVIKVQRDAGDVLSAVRNFVTTCQQCQVQVAHVDPRLIDTPDHIVGHPGGNNNMSNKTMIAAMKKLQQEESHHPAITTTTSTSTPTTSKSPSGTSTPAATMKLSDSGANMVQKAKYPLNQDLVVSLRTHGNQIYGSTDALSTSVSFLLTLHRMDGNNANGMSHSNSTNTRHHHHHDDDDNDGSDDYHSTPPPPPQRPQQYLYEDSAEEENGKANVVHLFRSLSAHLSQFLGILEDIDVPAIADVDHELPSLRSYRADKQILYNGVGQLFGTVQQLTDQMNERTQAVEAIDHAIARVERAMEGILTDVGEMVLQRHAWMVRREDKNNNNNNAAAEGGGDLSLSPTTPHFYDAPEDYDDDFAGNNPPPTPFEDSRRRGTMASLRKRNKPSIDDSKACANWFLAPDYRPNELLFGNDHNVKGGTLAALVERLTMHDSFDTSYIATFLLTYRSFCTTEEFINLLQDRYNMQAPDDLTPEQLEIWTETKQKLVRLRVFNVLKNWLENYYDEEDGFILGRLEFFTNTVVRDASPFSADQLNRLIRKRKEAGSNQSGLKKLVPQVFDGPLPIMPKNMSHIRLLETDPLEMARQLSVCDFKLYSGIRPIECLNKAWSRDTVKGGVPVAANVIQSIDYCNRLTSWVTDSILSYDEAKKRVVIIKYWAQVAERCRNMNNYNTCMAIISAFDNSAIGRLKKTWELLGNRTSQALSQIRKLMGANRNFTEYREMVHSVNPPCIPFLGIYLQDLTFIEDGNPDYLKKSEGLINFAKRQKCAEVIQEIKQFQSPPYTFRLVPELQDFIKTHLETNRDVETLYERSLHLEPRETPSNTLP
ncbi:unnamed protein product [Absidia cylindrospora]